jgi:two-component system, chemotaxis family, protein-glutamate methylesterase/glutaminase
VGKGSALPVVCIGASAGGLPALLQVVRTLPPSFAAPVLVVVHSAEFSVLPSIVSAKGGIAAEFAQHGQRLPRGGMLVAPADHHLLVEDHRVVLSRGPKQNNFRPAIDPLFQSAARVYGVSAIGVILSGMLDDGSAGLDAIKRAGGVAIVQNPEDAVCSEMPRNALAAARPDYVLNASEIGAQINELIAMAPRRSRNMRPMPRGRERTKAPRKPVADLAAQPRGKITTLTCPECGGTLWEKRDGLVLRFLCHTGHGFSAQSLDQAQHESVEAALWVALRALKERALLLERLARGARVDRHSHTVTRYQAEALELQRQIQILRKVLLRESVPHS